MEYIDAHTHVHFPEFDEDRDVVIDRACKAGVGMITVGTDIKLTRAAIEVANHPMIWATAGLHPHEAKQYEDDEAMNKEVQELESLAKQGGVVAIGECGVDLFRSDDKESQPMQEKLFKAQLELAHKLKLPIVIHSRDAFDVVLSILNQNKHLLNKEGVCHFFTGTKDIAKQFLELGFSFTFGGLVTFNREFDDVIRFIPDDKIMAETDAPFVAPASHRGSRNEPSYLPEVVTKLSEIKKTTHQECATLLLENTKRVFGL